MIAYFFHCSVLSTFNQTIILALFVILRRTCCQIFTWTARVFLPHLHTNQTKIRFTNFVRVLNSSRALFCIVYFTKFIQIPLKNNVHCTTTAGIKDGKYTIYKTD